MEIYDRFNTSGSDVSLYTGYDSHISDQSTSVVDNDTVKPFAEVLFSAVEQVNTLQNDATALEEALVVAPEEVNIHEVIIASEQARLSVSFMKTMVETALKAYNEIMMIR